MKKRLISMLLALLMVMSLFAGTSFSANAETVSIGETIQYTMASGDYVLRICQRLGLNYYVCKDVIMALNNISEAQWRFLPVGKVLTLPASDADAVLIAKSGISIPKGTGTTILPSANTVLTPTTSTTTSTATQTASAASIVSNDIFAYYLMPYTMSTGETVAGVCNAMGISFTYYASVIKNVNGISNWSKVRAGQTILLPTVDSPAVGTTVYKVYAHKLISGENAYNICSTVGINYGAYTSLLKALNSKDNLSKLKAGEFFYYPIPTTIAAPAASSTATASAASTTGASSTAATTTTTTATTTTTNGTSTTTTSTKAYALTSNVSSAAGTVQFFVNNKAVNTARAGEVVTVLVSTNNGKAFKNLVVKQLNGGADILMTGDSFIMPACDIRVEATISNGHSINIQANYLNKTVATVGGVAVSAATKDSVVLISSVDPMYEIVSVYAYYKPLMGGKQDLNVSASNGFVMPDHDVTVEVTLKPVSTHDFYVNVVGNGSFFLQVNGSQVTRATKGTAVTIISKALDGFSVSNIQAVKHGTTENVSFINNNTFIMPDDDVDVTVTFGNANNNILIMPGKGVVKAEAKVSGKTVTSANQGATVSIEATYAAGYSMDGVGIDVVRNNDGLKVNAKKTSATTAEFVMPAGGVTVTPLAVGNKVDIEAKLNLNGVDVSAYKDFSFYVSSAANGRYEFRKTGDVATGKYSAGEYLTLSYGGSDLIGLLEYKVYVWDGSKFMHDAELSNQANLHEYIEIPVSGKIRIEGFFVSDKVTIGQAIVIKEGSGTVSYKNATGTTSINACDVGEKIHIVLAPSKGFSFDNAKWEENIFVTRKDTGAELVLSKAADNDFVLESGMPIEGIDVVVYFKANGFKLTLQCFDEKKNDLSDQSIWQISVNGETPIVANGTTPIPVSLDDGIVISMTDAGRSKYELVSVTIDGQVYNSWDSNYNFNFRMSDERAKDMTVVATVRPVKPTPVAYALNAAYDGSMGSVGFIIKSSPSGYSKIDGKYVTQAYTGDVVNLKISSNAAYVVDENTIKIYGGDASYIEVTKESATSYLFTMPEGGVYAEVGFQPKKHKMTVEVTPSSEQGKGYVSVAFNGVAYADVATKDTFSDVPFASTVQLTRTAYAAAQGYAITKVEVKDGSSAVPVTAITDGFQFTVPDAAGTVEVKVTVAKTAPGYSYYLNSDLGIYGKMTFTNAANVKVVSAQPGEKITVELTENNGFKRDRFEIKNTSGANVAVEAGANKYEFTMPEGGVYFDVAYSYKTYKLTVKISDTAEKVNIDVNGVRIPEVANDNVIEVKYNDYISVAPVTSGKQVTSMKLESNTFVTNFNVPVLTGDTSFFITLA